MHDYDVVGKAITELQKDMESGNVTSEDLVIAYMERIAAIDKSGPCLNSVAELNVEALETARALDRERKCFGKRSDLHGIPVLLKDNIETAGQMHTRCGTWALRNYFANRDAELVKRLKKAGAIILGKTNMSEMAKYFSTRLKNGYSSYGGQVLNAYCADEDAGGSSTGSAVAVAASLCAAAIGSETCGSILFPSSQNSVVGMKPTLGMISRDGIIPLAYSQDTAGPITRTVADAALLMGILSGEDRNDVTTYCRKEIAPDFYSQGIKKECLRGLAVGVNRSEMKKYTRERCQLFENALKIIENMGAVLIDADMPDWHSDRRLLAFEFKKNFEYWASARLSHTEVKTLRDFINYNYQNKEICLKYGQDRLEESEFTTSGNLTEPEYIRDRINTHREKKEFEKFMKEKKVSLMISPQWTDIPAIAGFPAIQVPAGYERGKLPFGITFYSTEGKDELILRAAFAFEKSAGLRREPTY